MGKNLFKIVAIISFTIMIDFFLTYYINNFNVRLYLFIYFDGISGIYEPTISVLKSSLIAHKIRSTVMNLFRLPRNIFSIILLFGSSYLSTYQICLVVVFISFITFFFALCGFYLLETIRFPEKIRNSIVIKVLSKKVDKKRKNNLNYEKFIPENKLGLLEGYQKIF